MFLEKLRKIRLEHQSSKFNEKERSKYYDSMKDNIRVALCEANFDIIEQDPDQKNLLSARIKKLPNKDIKCLPKKLELSSAIMNDFNFFNKIFKFLKQSRNQLRKLRRNKPVGVKKNQRTKKRTKN